MPEEVRTMVARRFQPAHLRVCKSCSPGTRSAGAKKHRTNDLRAENHSGILRFNENAHAAGICVNVVVGIARFRFLVPEVVWPSKGAQMDVGKGLADEGVVGGKIGGDRQVQCPVRIVMSVVVTEILHVLHQNRLDGMFYELWTSRTQSFHEPSILL